jgi:hypothetical protein
VQSAELTPTATKTRVALHRTDEAPEVPVASVNQGARKISRETLINRLNYLNFQSSHLTVLLGHRQNGRGLRLLATAEACTDENFSCKWVTPPPPGLNRGDFEILHLEVPHGHHILKVELQAPQLTADGMRCLLPEVCHQLTSRRIRRHFCTDIEVTVVQNGAVFTGSLQDYSAAAFRLELTAKPPQTFQWLKIDELLTVNFVQAGQTVLSTPGRILRSHGGRDQHTVVIAPTVTQQRRFPPKRFRNRRLELRPAPEVVFTHPLTRHLIRLDIADLSGSGMAVVEAPQEAQLLPGMQIERLDLRLADSFSLNCQAQVVYCQRLDDLEDSTALRCGLAILDMDVSDHTRLLSLLHRADDRSKGVCPRIDLDQLWEFFFTSGFIYPQKYQSLKEYRDEFKATYAKLYDSAPEIARHFIYQENSRIVGHMGMLRQFSNSWLIHHHAADRTRSRTAGLEILELAGEAVNEAQALYSAHMDYVMCFYRPENRFPQRVFGGVANHYDDPSLCSVDTFDYFHYRKEYDLKWRDSGTWELTPAKGEDLLDLEAFYQNRSGGLMLQGMDLLPQHQDDTSLQESYQKAGFHRQQSLFALKKEERTVAIFMLLRTEVGLNLSNLTNAITVLVLDNKALPREAFFTAVSMLAARYPQDEVPVLTYPSEYANSHAIEVEKQYNLWVLDCQHLDPYFEFCGNIFKRMNRPRKEPSS